MDIFRRWYGAHPLHLLALLASLALVGYAAQFLLVTNTVRVAVWLVGAAVLHDVVLLPLYVLADRSITEIWRRAPRQTTTAVPWLNHVRFPGAISLLLLLIFFPEISRRRTALQSDSRLSSSPYLAHWLLVTGILFAVSALLYALRLRRHRGET